MGKVPIWVQWSIVVASVLLSPLLMLLLACVTGRLVFHKLWAYPLTPGARTAFLPREGQLFTLAESPGGTDSLNEHPPIMTHALVSGGTARPRSGSATASRALRSVSGTSAT
jgi:hypothetical protein